METLSLEKQFKKDPINILELICFRSINNLEISDEEYYEILRLRDLLTPKIIKTKAGKIIEVAFRSGHAYRFVKALEEHELLELIFPGIARLVGVDGGHYHHETVFTHVMGALRALDPLNLPWHVKLAALYHDVGKSKWEISDAGRRRFTNHAKNGVPIVESDLKALGIERDIINSVKTLVGLHMSQIEGPHSIRKLSRALDNAEVPSKYFFWVRYADNKGSAVHKTDFMYYWRLYMHYKRTLYVKKVPSVSDLVVNGNTLMKEFNRKQGRWLGAVLRYLFVGVQERGYQNTEEYLLKEAHKFMDWYGGE